MSAMLHHARAWAVAAHGDQRYGDHPYSIHLDAVAEALADFGKTAQTVGYLHDVIEDTARTHEDVAGEFGPYIAQCTSLCTDEPGATRKARKLATHAKLARVGPEHELALVVKTADRLANLRTCTSTGHQRKLTMYCGEHDAFRAAVWRAGLADVLWREIDTLISSVRSTRAR